MKQASELPQSLESQPPIRERSLIPRKAKTKCEQILKERASLRSKGLLPADPLSTSDDESWQPGMEEDEEEGFYYSDSGDMEDDDDDTSSSRSVSIDFEHAGKGGLDEQEMGRSVPLGGGCPRSEPDVLQNLSQSICEWNLSGRDEQLSQPQPQKRQNTTSNAPAHHGRFR